MRWVTYFPEIENVHLVKDVGMIPLYAGYSGFKSLLVGHFIDTDYPNLQGETKDLDTHHLRDDQKWFFLDRAFLNWLKINAQEVDVLHLFHLTRDSIFYGAYYKRLNPEGKLYLKLDAYNDHLRSRKRYAINGFKNFLLKKVEKRFFKSLNLVSVENTDGYDLAAETYPEWRDKLIYLPNGCNDVFLKRKLFEGDAKENLILSVGRVGSADKNYELLLKALPNLNFRDWKMVVAGPVSEGFSEKITELFKIYPHLEKKVTFTGEITDRDVLYDYYSQASVFFLPSRFESFGIAFVEALFFGCVLVGHDKMAAYSDISDSGEFGEFYADNDPDSFSRAIEKATVKARTPEIAERARSFAEANFSWSKLSEKLMKKLLHEN
jgi:glycosyltransferase involved in cell wall biosynthesis